MPKEAGEPPKRARSLLPSLANKCEVGEPNQASNP